MILLVVIIMSAELSIKWNKETIHLEKNTIEQHFNATAYKAVMVT